MYFRILLLIHVAGAIIGFGPSFTFSILGPMAGKAGPPGGLAIMEAMAAIARRLVVPVALVIQPVTGVLLIFEGGWGNNFFGHPWLWISILLYVISFYISVFVNLPALEKMIALGKEGRGGTPDFVRLVQRTQRIGPALTLMLVVIIFSMIWKPGG